MMPLLTATQDTKFFRVFFTKFATCKLLISSSLNFDMFHSSKEKPYMQSMHEHARARQDLLMYLQFASINHL